MVEKQTMSVNLNTYIHTDYTTHNWTLSWKFLYTAELSELFVNINVVVRMRSVNVYINNN